MNRKKQLFKLSCYYAWDRVGFFGRRLIQPGYVSIPRLIDIKLTFRCNLRCKQCSEWQRSGHRELSISQWKHILLDIKKTIGPCYIRFYGGEPFVYEGILDLVDFCSDNGLMVLITTNATLVNKDIIRCLAKGSVGKINVSLDGSTAARHDNLRGCLGVFDKVMFFLEEARRCFAIEINTTIMNDNINELVDLAILAKEKKVAISYQGLMDYTTGRSSIGTKENVLFPQDAENTARAIDNLIRLRRRGYPIVNSPRQMDRLKRYYRGILPEGTAGCEAIGHHLRVLPDGRLNLCPWTKPVGNLSRTTLKEIWNSPVVAERIAEMKECDKFFCRIMRGGYKDRAVDKIRSIAQVHLKNYVK